MFTSFIKKTIKLASILTAIIVLLILNFYLWKKDYTQESKIVKLQKELANQKNKNRNVFEVNKELKQKVDSLRKGSMEMIEEEARNDFGMVGEGETFYHFENKSKNKATLK